jgi:hypothetical protein
MPVNGVKPEIRRPDKKKRERKGISPWKKAIQGVLDYIDDDNDDLAMN